MRGHCSARGQIGTGPVREALAGPAWALHSIVGWIVAKAFNQIFKEYRVPKYLWTDKGKEFYKKNLKEILDKRNVKLYSTENE